LPLLFVCDSFITFFTNFRISIGSQADRAKPANWVSDETNGEGADTM
jgi:hypothetical protein